MKTSFVVIAAALMTAGCATIVDGTTQTVDIRTAPIGATCTIMRGADTLGVIQSTPGSILVQRSRKDLTILCVKTGWQPSISGIASQFTGVTIGNAIIGGFPGLVTDSITGSDFLYNQNHPIILMSPLPPGRDLASTGS